MPPTILIVGATGNTGQETVRTLSKLLDSSKTFSSYRLLAQTRSANGAAAQKLAKLPHVQVIEHAWSEITQDWLRDQQVIRAFIASHNQPSQFAEESSFLVACLKAHVKYVVRISTTAANVFPSNEAYYPRTHWAIEALLSSPDFAPLHWSSLQPNVFFSFVLGSAAEIVKAHRRGHKAHNDTLRLILDENTPTGVVHPDDVGNFAAHLLLQDDTAALNTRRYVLNGPQDVTGAQIVRLVEEAIGAQVEDVRFKDVSFVDDMVARVEEGKGLVRSIKHAPETTWEGKASVATTSKEVLELAPPTRTVGDAWREALEG